MSNNRTKIRYGEEDDLHHIVDIINYYVDNHHSTFYLEHITVENRREWFKKFFETGLYRLIVAEQNSRVVGFACNGQYRKSKVFDRTTETTIYLDPSCTQKGIGSLLYKRLFEELKTTNLHLAVVGIALPNERSIEIHKKFEFEEVGIFKEYAYVKDQYFSSIWMQKRL